MYMVKIVGFISLSIITIMVLILDILVYFEIDDFSEMEKINFEEVFHGIIPLLDLSLLLGLFSFVVILLIGLDDLIIYFLLYISVLLAAYVAIEKLRIYSEQ